MGSQDLGDVDVVNTVTTVSGITEVTNVTSVDTVDTITEAKISGKTDDTGTTFQTVRIDAATHMLVTVEDDEHHIHEGDSFTAYYARTTDATDGHRSGLYIKTPSGTKLFHLIASFACSTGADLSVLEAPTIAANVGTHANVIYNRFRDDATASIALDNATSAAVNKFTTLDETEINGDGTWATGTVLRTEPLTVGSSPKPAGGSSRGTQEYILKANTAYVFLLTNTAASANDHLIEIDWYEHVDLSP